MSSSAERAELPTPEARGPLRFVTAASLFDGHDAAINIIRRILQAHGAEVVHLGHNRAVAEIVRAAIQEDADGIAVSVHTFAPPPDWPMMVTFPGSPPKLAMLSRTHARAASWSSRPSRAAAGLRRRPRACLGAPAAR